MGRRSLFTPRGQVTTITPPPDFTQGQHCNRGYQRLFVQLRVPDPDEASTQS